MCLNCLKLSQHEHLGDIRGTWVLREHTHNEVKSSIERTRFALTNLASHRRTKKLGKMSLTISVHNSTSVFLFKCDKALNEISPII